MTRTAPRIKPPRTCGSQNHLMQLETNSCTSFAKTTTGFFRTSKADVLCSELLQIICRQRLYIAIRGLGSTGVIELGPSEMQAISKTQMQVDYRLLCLPFEGQNDSTLSPIQNIVRLSLFVFAQPIVNIVKSSSAFNRSMTLQIRASLEQIDLCSLEGTSPDLLTWVLFILGHISRGQPEYGWAASHLARLLRKMQLESIDDLRDVLSEFYYFDNSFEETLKDVWPFI